LQEFQHWTRRVEELDRRDCTRCGACLGMCPEGIEIPKVMRLYDQLRFFGMDAVARYKYSLMPTNGSSCTNCGRCEEVCPEPIAVAELVREAHEALTSLPNGRSPRAQSEDSAPSCALAARRYEGDEKSQGRSCAE
jgi:predicted aldo/keto reductase-like oxidoreductase